MNPQEDFAQAWATFCDLCPVPPREVDRQFAYFFFIKGVQAALGEPEGAVRSELAILGVS